MSETSKRILSAFALMMLITLVLIIGNKALLLFIGLVGLLLIDEVFINFFKISKRLSSKYILGQLSYALPYFIFAFVFTSFYIQSILLLLNLCLVIIMILYLFTCPNKHYLKILGKYSSSLFAALIASILLSFLDLAFYPEWKALLLLLFVCVYGMDTGAWFVGKNWGKTKLYEKVSPKKTVEGLIGGMVISSLLTSGLFFFYTKSLPWFVVLFFFLLAGISQMGDLFESKLKRECDIKDSSKLIPGHGGIFDRVDALIFTAPLFFVAVRYYFYSSIL